MNDDPTATRLGGGAAHGRAEEVLRRGGVVEHEPPPHVWKAVRDGAWRHGPRGRTAYRGTAALLAAAAAGALLTWAGTALTDPDAAGEVLASGALESLSGDGVQGSAEVVDVDGHQRLRVSLADRPETADGYLEVWLLRPDVSGMVTLGVLEGDAGEYLLPPGLDLSEYAVVDISREHLDGDPGHGGDSLVRGQVG